MNDFERWLLSRYVGRQIFELLCEHPYGLTREQIVAKVWNGSKEPDTANNCVHVHMVKLRRGLREHLPWLDIQNSSYHPRLGVAGRRYLLVVRKPADELPRITPPPDRA